MDWKIQHSKDVGSPQIDIVIDMISTKYSGVFFVEIDKIVLKCMWDDKEW